ncbi:MAG: SusC/RagA family TonB-linked outer membrane protein, partial [Tannerellaceae bacterium]|nr:SusC/RagA family TonB-linked outer membrane protein [Tannerellaceae bacterium]
NEFFNNYLIDNIITYRDAIGKNNFTLMGGSSVRKERWEKLYGTANDVPEGNEEYWYLMQGANDSRRAEDDGSEYRGASWFGRLMYDYDGRYLLSATFRADGSSKYQEKWGYFPSIGLGWNITREAFMKNQRVFDCLKIRGSWGKLGNDKIVANDGFASVTQDLSTTGIFNDTQVLGIRNLGYFTNLKWEVVTESNIGFDFTVLNNRLSGEFEYYKRKTTNAVYDFPLPFGAGTLKTNNGEIENSGIELNLNWSDRIGNDFTYNVGFNLSTLKNKVTYLNGLDYINTGSAEFRTVRMLGEAVDSYYGYEVIGVYQTQAQVDADPIAVKNGLQPGDFIYRDVNGDGDITDEDRVILGSPLPKLAIGGNIGFTYKNFDFNLVYQGQFGNKIANQKRGVRRWQGAVNFDEDLYNNRWTGAGSTNKYPSAAGLVNPWNIAKFNSFTVENGSSFTIQNIQVGYTFHDIIPNAGKKTMLRLSLTAERPFSFFSYNGFTTDIPSGFDITTYPLASTYSFGVKLIY